MTTCSVFQKIPAGQVNPAHIPKAKWESIRPYETWVALTLKSDGERPPRGKNLDPVRDNFQKNLSVLSDLLSPNPPSTDRLQELKT